jgi:hypothetical protein
VFHWWSRSMDLSQASNTLHHCSGRWLTAMLEMFYSLRYSEVKQRGERSQSVIRQSALYHQYNATTRQSLHILFSPTPRSALHKALEAILLQSPGIALSRPFWLHEKLFETHLPAWRRFFIDTERRFLPIVCLPGSFAGFVKRD